MQTPQTNQTIKQFTPKTKFLIFVKSGLLQYNTTNKGSRPEILDDPGERRGSEKRVDDCSTPPTRDSAPCRRRASVEINFHRETTSSEKRNRQCKEEERHFKATIKGSTLTQIMRILDKRNEVNGGPRCLPRVGGTKG